MCNHSTPSSDFTDFRAWLAYQVEAETEVRQLLSDWEGKKRTKLEAGMAALVETTEIARCRVRLDELIANVRLGILLEALADEYGKGRIELGNLRFLWSSTPS